MQYDRFSAKRAGLVMGCKYRQRTGSCSCDNPPIGCCEPEDRPDRRAPARPAHAEQRSALEEPPPPPPLPVEFPIHGRAMKIPATGWRCQASDAAEAIAAGVRFLDVSACADVALDDADVAVVACVLGCDLASADVVASAESTAARVGRPLSELLMYMKADDSAPAAAQTWCTVHASLNERVGALGMECTSGVAAGKLMRELQASSMPFPSAILFPTNPANPHRPLVGLCRRLGVQPIAICPAPRPSSDADSTSAASYMTEHEDWAAQFVGWALWRGMPALLCGTDADDAATALKLAHGAPRPLSRAERLALDTMPN